MIELIFICYHQNMPSFTDRSKAVLLLWIVCVFVSCVSHAFASVHCCLVVICWERADLLAIVGDVYCIFVTIPCGICILGQVWYLIVSFPDICRLSYFLRLEPLFLQSITQLCFKNVLIATCPVELTGIVCTYNSV